MTNEQIDAIWHCMGSFWPNDHREFARQILAAAAGERVNAPLSEQPADTLLQSHLNHTSNLTKDLK